ncbi:MAG: phosphoribosylformylglycinamidine synthase subunit PurQ [Deltaproteobacteria bacterium]|nr:phosphoribosylformylglycinamidine synthase subunit PurQ [Deltaproteobacteria bacterium]
MKAVRALVLTGYGLNCDYETDFSLKIAGANSERLHINELLGASKAGARIRLDDYHILVFGGGFSWADDHGAGVIMATRLRYNIGEEIEEFIGKGKLILGICNGFQALVNFGLLPGINGDYRSRRVAITYNDSGNFINTWIKLKVLEDSRCVFTRGISALELPVRHGDAEKEVIDELFEHHQVSMQYVDAQGNLAQGRWPLNPNGSLYDIAGICDSTGRIFGLMPHPEAYNHYTNHPDWAAKREQLAREGKTIESEEGEGIAIFRNAVQYVRENL